MHYILWRWNFISLLSAFDPYRMGGGLQMFIQPDKGNCSLLVRCTFSIVDLTVSRDFLPFFATHQGLKGLFFIWFSPGVPYDSWSSNPLEFLQYLYYLQIYWIFLIFSFLTVNSYLMEKIVNFYRTYRYLVFAPWTQTRWNFYDIFFSTESWDAQLACFIYFTSIRLKTKD